MLNSAPPGQEFVFHDQSRAKDLHELLERIRMMPAEEFQSFVSASKNDFASWTEHVLHEESLAQRLRTSTNQDALLTRISEKLEEHTAQQNLFTLAQHPAQSKTEVPSDDASAQEPKQGATVSLPLLERKLLVRQLITGVVVGIVIGFVLARIITTWFL